jgi:hypothetical protein
MNADLNPDFAKLDKIMCRSSFPGTDLQYQSRRLEDICAARAIIWWDRGDLRVNDRCYFDVKDHLVQLHVVGVPDQTVSKFNTPVPNPIGSYDTTQPNWISSAIADLKTELKSWCYSRATGSSLPRGKRLDWKPSDTAGHKDTDT